MRLGFYLIPPYPLSCKIMCMRDLVYDQYRIKAALNFMIHMTIKGFFKPIDNINMENLIGTLDNIIQNYRPFKIYPSGLIIFKGEGLGITFSKTQNKILWEIQERCFKAIKPFVSPDCEFTKSEQTGDKFIPHITISMTDVTNALMTDMMDFFKELEFDTKGYLVHNFKLYKFESDNWDSDDWIYSLKWKILKSWILS